MSDGVTIETPFDDTDDESSVGGAGAGGDILRTDPGDKNSGNEWLRLRMNNFVPWIRASAELSAPKNKDERVWSVVEAKLVFISPFSVQLLSSRLIHLYVG